MYTGMEGQVEWSGRESFCKEGTFKLRFRLERRSETDEEWWAKRLLRPGQSQGRARVPAALGLET